MIRTKNEAAHLASTLEAVLHQSFPPDEILVIDSGSSDHTLEMARRYPVEVLEISPQEWSYPRALNVAAGTATGDILVCLSAHCVPVTRDWMRYLVRHFEDPAVAGVWGPGLRPGRSVPDLGDPERQLPGSYDVTTRMWGLSNANSAVRRDLWMDFPFDEALPAAEDKAWGREAMNRGYCIVYEPGAAVWHESHSLVRAYRRNRAVLEGFRMMFPEIGSVRSEQLDVVRRAAWRTLIFHTKNRQWRTLLNDLERIPSTVAAISGVLVAELVREFRMWRKRSAGTRAEDRMNLDTREREI